MFPVFMALMLVQSPFQQDAQISVRGLDPPPKPETATTGATNPKSEIDQGFIRRFNVIIDTPPPPSGSGGTGQPAPSGTRERNLARDGQPPTPRLPPRPR